MHSHKNLDVDKIKSELNAYRSFAFKKNMLEMAIAFILANSLNKVVTALSDDVLMPLTNFFTNSKMEQHWTNMQWTVCHGLTFEIGKFIGSLMDFTIITVLFYIIYVKFLSPITSKLYPSDDILCEYCQMTINKNAKKCPFCTTNLEIKS